MSIPVLLMFALVVVGCGGAGSEPSAGGTGSDGVQTNADPGPASGGEVAVSSTGEIGVAGTVMDDDLARFAGEYGTPESQLEQRTFWVYPSCGGHLVAGAMWGAASPWHLDRVSETGFVQRVPEGVPPVHLEFELDADGEVAALRVLYEGQPFLSQYPRLPRLRPIPTGFEDLDCFGNP